MLFYNKFEEKKRFEMKQLLKYFFIFHFNIINPKQAYFSIRLSKI